MNRFFASAPSRSAARSLRVSSLHLRHPGLPWSDCISPFKAQFLHAHHQSLLEHVMNTCACFHVCACICTERTEVSIMACYIILHLHIVFAFFFSFLPFFLPFLFLLFLSPPPSFLLFFLTSFQNGAHQFGKRASQPALMAPVPPSSALESTAAHHCTQFPSGCWGSKLRPPRLPDTHFINRIMLSQHQPY